MMPAHDASMSTIFDRVINHALSAWQLLIGASLVGPWMPRGAGG
jgi:hypothetical protein